MELTGKKINFLGDSITAGSGTSDAEHNYVSVFGRLSGAEVRNYGLSGSRIARQKSHAHPNFDDDFVLRAADMDGDADIVVVFGGTNDYGHGDAPLGNFESRDPYTFYGAMHTLCTDLLNKYPKAEIVFMTPLHRLEEHRDINEIGIRNQCPLSRYVEIIKEVTAYYALPTLDLYTASGMQPDVKVIRETYMPDGLHPNDAGAVKLAKRLLGFLRAL